MQRILHVSIGISFCVGSKLIQLYRFLVCLRHFLLATEHLAKGFLKYSSSAFLYTYLRVLTPRLYLTSNENGIRTITISNNNYRICRRTKWLFNLKKSPQNSVCPSVKYKPYIIWFMVSCLKIVFENKGTNGWLDGRYLDYRDGRLKQHTLMR